MSETTNWVIILVASNILLIYYISSWFLLFYYCLDENVFAPLYLFICHIKSNNLIISNDNNVVVLIKLHSDLFFVFPLYTLLRVTLMLYGLQYSATTMTIIFRLFNVLYEVVVLVPILLVLVVCRSSTVLENFIYFNTTAFFLLC